MKKIICYFFTILLSLSFITFAQNTAPEVTNVRFEQRTDGTHIVDIYYDVTDAEQSTVNVSLEVSNDAGTNWNFTASSITSDIGEGIDIGNNKHIAWDFANDHQDFYSNQIQIKVIADDGMYGTPCPGIPTVTYMNQTYNTVQIGNQCWLKENLNVGEMVIPGGAGSYQKDNDHIEKYCVKHKTENCDKYGGLYEWGEAMQYIETEGAQGICPEGWHLPTYGEFSYLIEFVEEEITKLLDRNTHPNYLFTNETGFSLLLAGARSWHSKDILTPYSDAFLRSSTLHQVLNIDTSYLDDEYQDYWFYEASSSAALSIRCIKDQAN